jgi:hypothetical protein
MKISKVETRKFNEAMNENKFRYPQSYQIVIFKKEPKAKSIKVTKID